MTSSLYSSVTSSQHTEIAFHYVILKVNFIICHEKRSRYGRQNKLTKQFITIKIDIKIQLLI